MSILNIIEDIAAHSGKLDKLQILQDNVDNELLKLVFYYTLHPRLRYYFQERSFPDVELGGPVDEPKSLDPLTLDDILSPFYGRKLTGHDAANELEKILFVHNQDDQEILKRIILKDLKCGVSEKTINKVWKKLIPETPYMRCSLPDKESNITYPALVQTKADGAFCNVIMNNGVVSFVTRNGSPFELPTLAKEVEQLGMDGMVVTGEITISDGAGGVLPRKQGNGMVNKLIKRDQTQANFEKKYAEAKNEKARIRLKTKHEEHLEELERIEENTILELWEALPYDLWESGSDPSKYTTRMQKLVSHLKEVDSKRILLIKTQKVYNKAEAQEFYNTRVAEGLEGAVLKNMDMPWKNGTSTQQIKMKEVHDCDLEIVGWYHGKKGTSMEHGIGGYHLRSSCGELEVSVGSGFSRKDRGLEPINPDNISEGLQVIEGFDFEHNIGKIAAVQFNAVDIAKGKTKKSLFLPILVEVREDKTEADSLEMIEEAVAATNKPK